MSKYARQRARTDRRHGRVPKYTSGVQFPEKDPTVGGWEIAGSAGQGMSAGASLGAIAGPYGQAIGAVVGAGVGLGAGIAKRNATNRRNRRIEEAEKNYELYGNKATDPKLQMLQAEKGVQMKDSVEIEIEGKNGLGEIHTDADFNIKNVGTRPHTKGGDRVMAVEGDVVFPTQNSKKSFKEILGLINRAKQGDKEAEEELEERRKKLPEDDTDKYTGGTQGVKSKEEQIKEIEEKFKDLSSLTSDERAFMSRRYLYLTGQQKYKLPAYRDIKEFKQLGNGTYMDKDQIIYTPKQVKELTDKEFRKKAETGWESYLLNEENDPVDYSDYINAQYKQEAEYDKHAAKAFEAYDKQQEVERNRPKTIEERQRVEGVPSVTTDNMPDIVTDDNGVVHYARMGSNGKYYDPPLPNSTSYTNEQLSVDSFFEEPKPSARYQQAQQPILTTPAQAKEEGMPTKTKEVTQQPLSSKAERIARTEQRIQELKDNGTYTPELATRIRQEEIGLPKQEEKAVQQPLGPTVNLPGGVPSFNQRLPYEQPLSENGRNPYLTNSKAPKPVTWEGFPENPYKPGYKSPLIPSMQVEPVLDTNGSPMLNPFTMKPFTTEELGVPKAQAATPTGTTARRKGIQGKKPSTMTESDIVDFITGNQDVNSPAELAARAKAKGVPEELLLNTLDKIHKDFLPNATGTRNSTRPYGNIGPKTYSAFMLDKPTESIDYTDPTQEFKYPDAGIDPHSLDPFSVAPQSVATATKESAKRRVRDNLRNVGGNLRKQENSIMNTLASFEGIEGANPVNLNLERYAYEDMSQPAMREARKQRAIGRAAIQQGIGSRGQQVSYLTQNDAAVQDSIQKINEAEVARKLQIDNMNTDLTNKEKDFQAQDRLRIQDLLRRQRAAKRQFGQMASKERTERAYVDEQTDYMKSLDARKLERDMMLANLLREKNFDFTGVYDNEGNFNASNTTRYIK